MKKSIELHTQIFLGIFAGALVGFFFPEWKDQIGWVGDLFLRFLYMVIVPLLFSSIVSGITSISQGSHLAQLGVKTVSWYLFTSVLAIGTGLFFFNVIEPGGHIALPQKVEVPKVAVDKEVSFRDILFRMIPKNVFEALAQGEMLPIIVFALFFGIFLMRSRSTYRDALIHYFHGAFDVMMDLTQFVIRLTPYGIFAIIVKTVGEYASDWNRFSQLLTGLSLFMVTVLVGLAWHFFVNLSGLVWLFTGVLPWRFIRNVQTVLLTAFSTSSSAATLPTTISVLKHRLNIPDRFVSFIIPLGATINMDGTALYECVSALFIAKVYGIHLTFAQQLMVVFTALLASIGAAGVPMAGIVMMVVVFKSVGLPLEGIGIILTVDRILDMFRTSVNVYSDMCGAMVIASTERIALASSEENGKSV
jgi:Na+/H+-dicarboxylate symporter